MRYKSYIFVIAGFLCWKPAFSQSLPLELLVGDQKTTLDLMFFKYFKKKDQSNSKFLFFNRNRSSIDYKMTNSSNLPLFGCTEAISFNDTDWKGFAPVAVVQILNRGVYSKLGMQYARIRQNFTFFGWTVLETIKNPNIDLFILTRYTPKLTNKLNLYTQLELLSNLPTVDKNNFNFVQRIRIGLKLSEFQFGVGVDLGENGRTSYTRSNNLGCFLRYEF